MFSKQSIAHYILDHIADADAGAVSMKKMFGEYGIYCDGKMVAFVADDQLFIKPTVEGKQFIGDYSEGLPYPSAKPHLLIAGEKWDDHEWLMQLIKITATSLPSPKA